MANNSNSQVSEAALLFPWGWTIRPENPAQVQCPSPEAVLGTFAAVNAIVSTLSLFFGHRTVMRYITCGLIGNRSSIGATNLSGMELTPENDSYRYTWIITLGLQLGSNALVAAIIKNTPGFGSTFSVADLVLFFTIRPRLGPIFLGAISSRILDRRHAGNSPWTSSAISQFIADSVLMVISLVVLGRTVRFGDIHNYYHLGSQAYSQLPVSAHLMYGGALFTLVFTCAYASIFQMRCAISTVLGPHRVWGMDWYGEDTGNLVEQEWRAIYAVASLFVFLGSWLFWAGFVKLAGDL
jgi:hypothetical protein